MGIQGGNITDGGSGDGGGGGGQLYTGASPTTNTVGGLPSGSAIAGETLSKILQDILVSYQAPAFSSFAITGQGSPVEIGTAISGVKTFTWGTTNSGNVNANTIEIDNVTASTVLVSGSANDGSENLNIGSITFNASPQVFRVKGTNSQSTVFQRDFTIATLYPYFYGKVASGGAAPGVNRPAANQALINSGTKVVADSNGTITINFASTSDDYIWFAVPASAPTKTTWYVNALNTGPIGGAVSPAGNLFPAFSAVSITTVNWAGVNYEIYIANYQSAAASNMELRN